MNLIHVGIHPVLVSKAIESIHTVSILLADTKQHVYPEPDSICDMFAFQHLSVNPDKIMLILSPPGQGDLIHRYVGAGPTQTCQVMVPENLWHIEKLRGQLRVVLLVVEHRGPLVLERVEYAIWVVQAAIDLNKVVCEGLHPDEVA
jgi:hypothetical protein